MEKERKHTETPWVFDPYQMKIKGSGDIEGMTVIANVSPKMDYSRGMNTQIRNAEFIVKACNNHYQLLEALKEAQLQIEYLHKKFQETGTGNAVLSQIDLAIKQAEA